MDKNDGHGGMALLAGHRGAGALTRPGVVKHGYVNVKKMSTKM